MGQMLVFANAVEGRDDEFNHWYDEVHLAEVCAVAPFTGARRFRVADASVNPEQPYRYLAVYDFDGPASDAFDALMSAASGFALSETLDMSPAPRIVMVEEL